MLKLTVKEIYISHYVEGVSNWYMRKDGTLYSHSPSYWKTKKEAQQFLDSWLPKEKRLTVSDVSFDAQLGEKEALDSSIEHWKQNVLDVENANLGSSYCAICVQAEKNRRWGGISACQYCILNNYTKPGGVNCCKEYEAFVDNKTEENAIAMLNKLVLVRNKKYGNRRYGNFYEEKQMSKEMTVAQVAKELGYDVKIVKESVKPEPYQFKAGDVVDGTYTGKRIVVKQRNSTLIAVDMCGMPQDGGTGGSNFTGCGYNKVGELRNFIN